MFGPIIALNIPSGPFSNLRPAPIPQSLPPPSDERTLKSPFAIDATTYNRALNGKLPLTFAVVYIVCVTVLNQVNRRRGYKPYAISRTGIFKLFVLLHNALLAVYSGITCAAMLRALNVSLSGSMDSYGLPGAVDALCKLHGPRGLGDAVAYNVTGGTWGSQNSLIHLAQDMLTPDTTDVGRIWNEGLAFWGWFFYLSKFYEVVDTMIILAKGKRCSTLQAYHHAGAMLCMWAGIRYMSPPIWMFVLVNSGIHAIMYTYYLLVGMGFKIRGSIKRTLTTLQILQFLVGVPFAALHLFISYSVPVSIPYTFKQIISDLPAAATSIAASISSVVGNIDPTSSLSSLVAEATADNGAWLKKLIYRAGGSPALAENVRNHNRETFGAGLREQPLVSNDLQREITEIRYHNEWRQVQCIDTTGQAFAIWLNVIYLLPLTGLFLRFFWKSYIVGKPKTGSKQRQLSESVRAAARKTSDAVEQFGESIEKEVDGLSERVERTGKQVEKVDFYEKADQLKKEIEDFAKQLAGGKDVGEKVQEQEQEQEVDEVDEVKSSSRNLQNKGSVEKQVKKEQHDTNKKPVHAENKKPVHTEVQKTVHAEIKKTVHVENKQPLHEDAGPEHPAAQDGQPSYATMASVPNEGDAVVKAEEETDNENETEHEAEHDVEHNVERDVAGTSERPNGSGNGNTQSPKKHHKKSPKKKQQQQG